jgi:5'-nucleotidase
VSQAPNGYFYVNGTPTDCVHLALTGLLEEVPDMVISGINDGANMGDDTIYSGTVAAAMEGYLLGIPSFAVSMSQHNATHFEAAAKVVAELVNRYQKTGFPPPLLININVPDLPYEALQGIVITRLGKRHKAEPVIKSTTPRGDTVYWVGAAGNAQDAGDGTDFYALEQRQVSLTPLQIDLTQYKQLDDLKAWLGKHVQQNE